MISNQYLQQKQSDNSFAKAHDKLYQPSSLQLLKSIKFCFFCQSEQQHSSKCMRSVDSSYVTAFVFKHDPPRLEGLHLEDRKCLACQVSSSPSPVFSQVRICEKDLGTFAFGTEP